MSLLRGSWRLASAARMRAAPSLSVTVRHGGGGPKPPSNFVEPNGFLFNEKVLYMYYDSIFMSLYCIPVIECQCGFVSLF